jgi:transcriptional regulator with XRE-family HTH domain
VPKSSTIRNPPQFFRQPWVITPEQSRAARGWLAWSQAELAKQANVSVRTVAAFERSEKKPLLNHLAILRRVIETAGIRLLFDEDGAPAGIARQGARIDLSGDVSD